MQRNREREGFLMDGLTWLMQNSAGADTLLLVAVNGAAANTPGTYPCRVVGAVSPVGQTAAALPVPEDDDTRVSHLLSEVGVPANLLGCAYLRTGLTLILREPALGRTITRTLYPRIAEKHHTTVRSVERAIRHAIAQTFDRSGGTGYRAALGRLASPVGDRPTNCEFLAQAAEWLRLRA